MDLQETKDPTTVINVSVLSPEFSPLPCPFISPSLKCAFTVPSRFSSRNDEAWKSRFNYLFENEEHVLLFSGSKNCFHECFLYLFQRWTFKSSCALWHVCLIDSGVGKEMCLTIAVYQDVTTRVMMARRGVFRVYLVNYCLCAFTFHGDFRFWLRWNNVWHEVGPIALRHRKDSSLIALW